MKKKWMLIAICLVILMPYASGRMGFGPSEVFCSNQINTDVIGEATLINDEPYPQYGIFSLFIPYTYIGNFNIVESEIGHTRVICDNCDESFQRHEVITNYAYGDVLDGNCPKCGGHLTFFDPLPRDEYDCFSIRGYENFTLVPLENQMYPTWITQEKISSHGACRISIVYDSSDSYVKENKNKHWEMHLRGSSQEEKTSGFMVGGVDLRVLISFKFPLYIDTPSSITKGEEFTVKVTYGDPAGTWREIPDDVKVVFNGVTKPIDRNGQATFMVPETRKDYEYKIEAIGDDFLSMTKMLTTGETSDAGIISVLSQYSLLIIIVIVCILLVGFLKWRR